jgi:phosphoadenosine phosphosulfate reductase
LFLSFSLLFVRWFSALIRFADVRCRSLVTGLLARRDPDHDLWKSDPDACCYLRKDRPLKTALQGFDCRISGVKRVHGGARDAVRPIELEEGRIKLNPLALWTGEAIEHAFADWDLPRHPLVEKGYRSIGCIPCTRAVRPGEEARAGRWAQRGKTECGINGTQHARSRHDAG